MTLRAAIRRHLPVRRFEAGELLESFLVCAVASVLLTRFLLKVAGWPRLGGADLHIAHLLWGGLLMLAALVLLFSSVSRLPLHLASVVGGIGFGLFLDELGKFVTADNDYFWRPAVSLIYLCFAALYMVVRALARRVEPTPQASLVNALELAKEAVLRDLDPGEKRRALELLARCDPRDPLVRALRERMLRQETVPPALPELLAKLQRAVDRTFDRWVHARAFTVGFAAFVTLAALAALAVGILTLRTMGPGVQIGILGQFLSSAVAAGLVFTGLVRLAGSRVAAWRFFRVAATVSILVGQAFMFYRHVLFAMIGLAASLLIWVVAGVLLRRERLAEALQRAEREAGMPPLE